jgi:hypothetical protein
VRDIVFAREVMAVPSLSPQHNRLMTEQTAGPILRVVETLRDSDPERLAQFRREFEAIATDYFGDNVISQDYLMTRATKV